MFGPTGERRGVWRKRCLCLCRTSVSSACLLQDRLSKHGKLPSITIGCTWLKQPLNLRWSLFTHQNKSCGPGFQQSKGCAVV